MSRRRQLIAQNSTPQWMKDAAETYDIDIANLKLAMQNYTFVDYIQNQQGQYLQLDVNGKMSYTYYCKASVEPTTTYQGLFGTRVVDASGIYFTYSKTQIYPMFGGSANLKTFSLNYDEFYKFKASNWKFYVNNTYYGFAHIDDLKTPLILFACFNKDSVGEFSANERFCFFLISENESYKRVILPCVRKSDNQPMMIDVLTMTEYTNQSSGDFLYGQEVTLESKFAELSA